jgi:centromeric protein E
MLVCFRAGSTASKRGVEQMASEERILVSVRLRPVNAREAERGDGSDWECTSTTTLMFRGNIPERAMFPASYTYGG